MKQLNYGEVFKETFKEDSKVLDILNLNKEILEKLSTDELIEKLKRLEKEMKFLGEHKENQAEISYRLWACCFNKVEIIVLAILEKHKKMY